MPSFDIVSKVDVQTVDNAINTVKKEIMNRFDFKGAHVVIELNKKDLTLALESGSDMQLNQIIDVLISRSMKISTKGSSTPLSTCDHRIILNNGKLGSRITPAPTAIKSV